MKALELPTDMHREQSSGGGEGGGGKERRITPVVCCVVLCCALICSVAAVQPNAKVHSPSLRVSG